MVCGEEKIAEVEYVARNFFATPLKISLKKVAIPGRNPESAHGYTGCFIYIAWDCYYDTFPAFYRLRYTVLQDLIPSSRFRYCRVIHYFFYYTLQLQYKTKRAA